MDSVGIRVFSFSILPVIIAAGHLGLDRSSRLRPSVAAGRAHGTRSLSVRRKVTRMLSRCHPRLRQRRC